MKKKKIFFFKKFGFSYFFSLSNLLLNYITIFSYFFILFFGLVN